MFLFKRHGQWYIQYDDPTTSRTRRISTRTTRKADAHKFLIEFERKLYDGTPAVDSILLKVYADKYVSYLRETHSQKYARDAAAAFRSLIEFLGDIPLEQLSQRSLEEFFTSSFRRAKYDTARKYRTLKAAFNRAVEWEYLSTNPLKKVRLPRLPQNLPHFMTDLELTRVLDATKNSTIRDIFEFGYLTGCRQGEILNLKWQDVDMHNRLLKVANSDDFTTKSKRERIIPMNSRLFSLLERRKSLVKVVERDALVFGKYAKAAYSSNYVSRTFKRAAKLAGLDSRIHFHSLRHSTATALVRKNVPIAVVQKLLGHSNITTTMIYSHVTHEDLSEAVRKLTE